MNTKPILFNTDMVRAILDGRKTVARRVVKPKPAGDGSKPEPLITRPGYWNTWGDDYVYRQPYRTGDILYVRETWQYAYDLDGNEQPIEGTGRYLYAADEGPEPFGFWVNPDGSHRDRMPWHPSIHMPREAARIFLRVTDVRVERLQDITKWQAVDEGQPACSGLTVCGGPSGCHLCEASSENSIEWFSKTWGSTIKKADRAFYGWDANPWVFVISFERITKDEAM